jgi:hypothetical protein
VFDLASASERGARRRRHMIDRQPPAFGRRLRASYARARLFTEFTVVLHNSQKEKEAKRKTTADYGSLNRTFLLSSTTGHFYWRLTALEFTKAK